MSKYKFYSAGPFFMPEQNKNVKLITETLKKAGHTLFEPRLEAGNLNEELTKAQNEILNDNTLSNEEKSDKLQNIVMEVANKIFINDLKGIDECDELFADITEYEVDGNKKIDSGTLVEVGYSIAKGKRINLVDFSDRPKINIMLASAAHKSGGSCIRNKTELQDFANGEKVFDLGNTELE